MARSPKNVTLVQENLGGVCADAGAGKGKRSSATTLCSAPFSLLPGQFVSATQMKHAAAMPRDAIFPQVRVPLELRRVAEASLQENESLSELVETAVRAEVRRRAMRAEFLAEGHAAVAALEQDGRSVDADDLLQCLQRDKAVARCGKAPA